MAIVRKIIKMTKGRGRQDLERRNYFSYFIIHHTHLSIEIILIHDDNRIV